MSEGADEMYQTETTQKMNSNEKFEKIKKTHEKIEKKN